jgi:hypothetical protein
VATAIDPRRVGFWATPKEPLYFVFAVAFASLVVTPEGDLRLPLWFVIPEGDLRLPLFWKPTVKPRTLVIST